MLSFPFREPIIAYEIPANIAADKAITAGKTFEFIVGFIINIEPIAAIIIPSHCIFNTFSLINIKAKKLDQKGEVFWSTEASARTILLVA